MSHERSIELLRRLTLAAGPPGAEDEVRGIVRAELDGLGTIRHDRLGSILCEKRGDADGPRVLVDSHLDEVAFMVQSIGPEGRLAFVTLGGWWGHVLLGQRVDVLGADGRRIPGVIGSKPPHFLSSDELSRVLQPDAMYIDLGASTASEVEDLGIRAGDMVVPRTEFVEMEIEGVLGCKAFDNRAGVALMCETLQQLQSLTHPNTVIGVGAVQEEIGARGAATATELVRPDVALVLECTPADDLPGQASRQGKLRGGPQIRHYDPTAVSNRRLVAMVQEVAAEDGLAVQMAVRRSGGTDAGPIHRSRAGVPTVVIGVPARYIHSHFSLMHIDDYVAARELVLALVRRLDADVVEEFTRFD